MTEKPLYIKKLLPDGKTHVTSIPASWAEGSNPKLSKLQLDFLAQGWVMASEEDANVFEKRQAEEGTRYAKIKAKEEIAKARAERSALVDALQVSQPENVLNAPESEPLIDVETEDIKRRGRPKKPLAESVS